MKLVKNARRWWRWHSQQALAALAILPPVWASLPADLKQHIPPEWMLWVLALVAIGGFVGRFRDQGDGE